MGEFNFIPEEYLEEKNLKIHILISNTIKVVLVFIILSIFILNKNTKKLNGFKREERNLKDKVIFENYKTEENIFCLWQYSMNTLRNYNNLEKIEINKDCLNIKGRGDIGIYEKILRNIEINKSIRLIQFKSPNEENQFEYIIEVKNNEK